jgi:hypothetical protein
MTWTKLSDDFAEECADLSDAAFRTHVEGLLWTMRRETDGTLRPRDVPRLAESPDWQAGVEELVRVGFWEQCDNGYLIVHHMEHQPEAEVIEARRRNDAERQRRKRRKAAGLDVSRRDDPRDDQSDHPRDPGRVGTGREGTPKPGLDKEGRACCVCGATGSLLAGKDGQLRCRRHHFDQAAA